MPRHRTAGTWGPGQGGKPKGAKDHYPRSVKKLVETLLAQYASDPLLLDAAMRRGLLSQKPLEAAAYCRLVIDHVKGLPEQTLNLARQIVLSPLDAPALPSPALPPPTERETTGAFVIAPRPSTSAM